MSARVGIVVRTKDRPAFLARALEDIAAQRFRGWEVVVVNDGGDVAVVNEVVAQADAASLVRVVHIAAGQGGRCIAANTGVRATEAEYVVLHDDDDRWDDAFLEATVGWLEAHPQDAGVGTATEIVYEVERDKRWVESSRARFWAGMERLSLTEMLQVNRAVPISVLYRRALHEEVGWYDETLDAVEDWDFYLRVLAKHSLGFIDDPVLAYWTQRPEATGVDANSMFGLKTQHDRDDQVVRDRALAAWIEREGAGVPLYLAAMERRFQQNLDRIAERLERNLREDVRREIDAHQPVLSRVRRLRSRFRRR